MSALTSLHGLIDLDMLPQLSPYGALLEGLPLDELGQQIFIRGLRSQPNGEGDGVTFTLDLVILDGLGIEIPGSGFALAVNPTATPPAPSAFLLNLTYQLPALRYLDSAELDFLDGSPASYYQFLLRASDASPEELLSAGLDLLIEGDDPVQSFLDDYAALHAPLNVAIDPDPQVTIANIASAVEAAGVVLSELLFDLYMAALPAVEALEELAALFHRWYEFSPADLQALTVPFISGTLHRVHLSLQFPRALLWPLKTADQAAANIAPGVAVGEPLPEPFRSQVSFLTETVTVNSELGLDFEGIAQVNFSDSEIANTGLQIGVEEILLDFSSSANPAAITALGFSAYFKGVYARRARLRWLGELQIPGFDIEVAEMAIGNEGMALRLAANWGIDAAEPFGADSEMVGMVADGWGVALLAASGSLLYRHGDAAPDWQSDLTVRGLLQIPFWSAIFDVQFGLQLGSDQASTQLHITNFSSPLAVALGDGNQLIFDALSVRGTFEEYDTFSLSGSARGALNIGVPGLQLLQATFDVPTMALAHSGATTTMQLQGIFNARLFDGNPFAIEIHNITGRLLLEASGATIDTFSLDLADLSVDLQFSDQISLHVDDCLLDLNPAASPQAILDFGYDESFMGLLSRQTTLSWVIPGVEFAGALELGAVIIGNDGVQLRQSWPDSPYTAQLMGDWAMGFTSVDGLLVFTEEGESRLDLAGFVDIPLFQTSLNVRLFMQNTPFGQQARLALSASEIVVDLGGAGILTVADLSLEGSIDDDNFSLFGYVGGGSLMLTALGDPFTLSETTISFSRQGERYRLELDVQGLGIPLGDGDALSAASLLKLSGNSAGLQEILIEGEAEWSDVDFVLLPDFMPQPPTDAELSARLHWATTEWQLSFAAALSDVDALFGFLPRDFRPETADATFELSAVQETGAGGFQAQAAVALSLRLPDLPGLPVEDLFVVETGDADGWIDARVVGGTRTNADTGAQEPYMEMEIANPVSIDVNFPGMPQPQPPIHTAISRVDFDISTGDDIEGSFTLAGDFALRPVEPPTSLPMAAHLGQLMAPITGSDLVGSAVFSVQFRNDKAALSLDCTFCDAEIELDVFDMIANLSSGIGPPEGESEGNDFPLDIDVGFGLRGIKLQLGALEETAAAGDFSMEMVIGLSLASMSAELFFLLSEQEFSLGLAEGLEIPLHVPEFPLSPDDLDYLRSPDGDWTEAQWNAHLADLDAAIAGYGNVDDDPVARREKAKMQAQEFLLQNMLGIFLSLRGAENRRAYQSYVESVVAVFYATTSALHVESDIKLVLSGRRHSDGSLNENGVRFTIPFGDPRNIGLHGAAYLDGFADEDPFKALEDLQLGLGLSSDMIYFSLDSLGTPIEIPPVGRYDGGSVNLSRLRIGYGYTKNSLSVNFAGEAVFPEQLVEDADTSDLIGAGVRLPTHNALSFKLDLIPVVLGPVDFVVPLFEFDLDLRQPTSQALVSSQVCQPYWDGLQIVIPGLYHDSLKHLAFSPMFSLAPIPNIRFDGDFVIGDENNGLTIITDNVLVLVGYFMGTVPMPVPFFANPFEPYFDNLCVNIRLAGFGLNFNLQRPFPSLSPLAIFEVLGLLSDPAMPIDPAGSLANTIRVSLTDAYLTLPPAVIGVFPELAGVVDKPLNLTLNLGTLITIVQALAETAGDVAGIIEDGSRDMEARLQQLANNPPEFNLGAVLRALPPELRKYRLSASLAGFEAAAVLLLVDANDIDALRQEFRRRHQAAGAPITPTLEPGTLPDPQELASFRPNLEERQGGGRTYYPDDPANSLFKGIEFDAFGEEDFALVPPPARLRGGQAPPAGVVVGAHLKLFTGQRFRFLGFLFEDGSFSLISALDIPPLALPVAGIPITFPFAAQGRLQLSGRQKRDGYYGLIEASGWGRWQVIPGVARLEVASRRKPATLKLHSNGQFGVAGDVVVSLFNNAASLKGWVKISHSHCFAGGELRYQVGQIVDLEIDVEGRFGPGPQFLLAGSGSLKILGQELTSVKGVISEQRAAFEARLNTGRWRVAGTELDCNLQMALRGAIDLRRKYQPEFLLEGEAFASVMGATIQGKGGIRRHNQVLTTYVEGALSWQGHEWLGGRLELGDAGVCLSGRTSLALNLTPSNLAGTEMAHLFMKLELAGEFTLDSQAGLADYSLRGDWLLAARTPGESGQIFLLAAQTIDHGGSLNLELPLISASGFSLVPFDGVQIPVPTLSGKTPPYPVRFGKINKNPAASWAGTKVELVAGVAPLVSPGFLTTAQTERKVYLNYKISFDGTDTIDIELPLEADFELSLVWRNKKLAIKVFSGGQARYINLSAAAGSGASSTGN